MIPFSQPPGKEHKKHHCHNAGGTLAQLVNMLLAVTKKKPHSMLTNSAPNASARL